jgi:hypothetical protein
MADKGAVHTVEGLAPWEEAAPSPELPKHSPAYTANRRRTEHAGEQQLKREKDMSGGFLDHH